MQAGVIVVTMKSWDAYNEDQETNPATDESMDSFLRARTRIIFEAVELRKLAHVKEQGLVFSDQQVNKFLYTTSMLNSIIFRYSRMAAVLLVSLPPPPIFHAAGLYMEYIDLLVDSIPRLLAVRGYRRDVVTIFT